MQPETEGFAAKCGLGAVGNRDRGRMDVLFSSATQNERDERAPENGDEGNRMPRTYGPPPRYPSRLRPRRQVRMLQLTASTWLNSTEIFNQDHEKAGRKLHCAR